MIEELNSLTLARIQFAFAVSFHVIMQTKMGGRRWSLNWVGVIRFKRSGLNA